MFIPSFNTQRGFSLIELLVSISIMVLITTIVVTNQHGYNNSQILKNAADVLALDMRTAEVYGTGVRETAPGSGNFQSDYGVMLETNDPLTYDNYILFTDQGVKNGIYDGGAGYGTPGQCLGSECLSRIDFPPGVTISSIISVSAAGAELVSYSRVDIVFRRPDTTPRIKISGGTDLAALVPAAAGMRITLASSSGEHRSVTIYQTGQISVQ